ncbi:LysM peptidoglycan-binding domain-containing protein [Microbacterium halophytorum]|uniref:LysM peptidoglycan-binding domain-containing protein n=1 Tax=Microbacterium halophytorum TaxID=2067568 RepID=UPI000CFE1919|nr:LysM peptidoglycan-binding domain-containing protein [Microbacterium halophytorum]
MSFTRTALTTAPVAVVGSLALSLGVADAASAAETHEVRPGETVTGIAINHGLQTRDVLRWNDISPAAARSLAPGTVLKLSGGNGAPVTTASATTRSSSKTHTVEPGDTLWSIAQQHRTSLSALVEANGFKASTMIFPGQKVKLTGTAPAERAASTPTRTTSLATAMTYTVSSGDTLWSIANAHGLSLGQLFEANGFDRSTIVYPGQVIRLTTAHTQPSDDGNAKNVLDARRDSDRTSTTGDSSSDDADANATTHTVEPGDTLWSIAHQYGRTVAEILEANDLEPGAIIYPGQELELDAPEPETVDNPQRFAALSGAQAENGALIIRVGRSIGASDRAIAEALATAMVESSLRNVEYGDRDSLGLFQQRASTGWGTKAQIMDRERSTLAFFGGANDPNGSSSRGLYDLAGWEDQPFGTPSQRVQVSAHPDRYAQWETQAYRWLAELA